MSRLDKLLLFGVRSFGNDPGDQQMVSFGTPLTLILGQNGCGKTTIIEALKVATCGEYPAGSGGGKLFVHDPKCANKTESRGHIKLRMYDADNKLVEVNRLFKVTQRLDKLTFATVDQNIKQANAMGVENTISSRCADIDNEMSNALGVSKAILNYVLFCHQEESSWPLDEGKKLKDRFDEIFDSTKFNKCFDVIDKSRKLMASGNKIQESNLTTLRERRDHVIEKREAKSNFERQMTLMQDEIAKLEAQMVPVSDQLQEIASKEQNIMKINTEYTTKRTTLQNLNTHLAELRNAITTIFQGTTGELRNAMNSFYAELKEKEQSLRQLEDRLESLKQDEIRITTNIEAEQVKVGQLQAEETLHKTRVADRSRILNRMARELEIPGGTQTQANETQVVALQAQVGAKVKEKAGDLETLRVQLEAEEQHLQVKIDECRDVKVKLETNILTKKQEQTTTKAECRKTKAELDEVDLSAGQLVRLEAKLERAKRELDEVTKAVDPESLKQTIKEAVDNTNRLDERLDSVNKEVQLLQQSASDRAELEIHERKLLEHRADVRRLHNKHDDTLVRLLGELPEEGFRYELQACQEKLTRDVKELTDQLIAKQTEVTKLEADRRYLKKNLQNKEEELRVNEEEIYECCGTDTFDSVVKTLSENINKLQDDVGTLSASGTLYRRFVNKLQANNPGCPLCHRCFPNDTAARELVTELQDKLRAFPTRLAETKDKLAVAMKKYDKLQQLKPKHANTADLKQVQLPKLRSELQELEVKLATSRRLAEELEMSRCVPQSDETLARGLQREIDQLDQHLAEIKKIEREKEHIEATLPVGVSERSMTQALAEQKQLRLDVSAARQVSETEQSRLTEHAERLQALREQKNALVEQQLKIKGGQAQRQQLVDRLAELQALEMLVADELERLQAELPSARARLDKAIRELDAGKIKNKASFDNSRKEVDLLERQLDDVMALKRSISLYEGRAVGDKLDAVRATLARLKQDGAIVHQDQEDQTNLIHSVQKDIVSRQSRERDLNDNLRLREKMEDERTLGAEVATLRERIGTLDYASLQAAKSRLRDEEEKINKKKHHASGRRYTLEEQLATVNKELSKDTFRTVEADYTNLHAELMVSIASCDDLQRFSRAMEEALIRFHTQRMKAVNGIMRELWRQVYRGNDIDYIEIKTDATEGVGGKRRVYNYRVVQMKGNAELDMRGRCSAGQKVLACLIIRLALAETFSTSCGIIALDEPTTNLDRENMDSLSAALSDLVSSRMAQKNFQLIVITHDENFLSDLCRGEEVKYYYKVERNASGKSIIQKKLVNS